MSGKFHITDSGDVRACNATKRPCKYGAEAHYGDKQEARAAYEALQSGVIPSVEVREKLATTSAIYSGEAITDFWSEEYDLAPWALEDAIASIEKANKKLKSAGFTQQYTYSVGERSFKNIDDYMYEYTPFKVEGFEVKIAGKEVVAVVDHIEEGSVVKTFNDKTDLEGFRPDSQYCDHCGVNRDRNKTFLVIDENGKKLQIGSSCIEAYTGIKPGSFLVIENTIGLINESCEDNEGYFGNDTFASRPIDEFIAKTLAIHETYGYTSRDNANMYGIPATIEVFDGLHEAGALRNKESVKILVRAEEIENDKKAIAEFKEYINSMPDTDYGLNVKTIAKGEYVGYKHRALLLSSVARYGKYKFEKENRKEWASGHVANVGEKVTGTKFTVADVVKKVDYDYYTGKEIVRKRVVLQDENGHQAIWWTNAKVPFTPGAIIEATGGTVKSHGNFNGIDQTNLTRFKANVLQEGGPDTKVEE